MNVILAGCLIPVHQLHRAAVGVDPVQLRRVFRDGADEAQRLCADRIIDIKSRERMAVLEGAVSGVGIIEVELGMVS